MDVRSGYYSHNQKDDMQVIQISFHQKNCGVEQSLNKQVYIEAER